MLSGILIVVVALTLSLYLAIAWGVVAKYRQTRNVGFLLLGVGVVLWPILGQPLWALFGPRLIERGPGVSGIFPFSGATEGGLALGELLAVFAYASHAVQAGLILLGILLIGRASNRNDAALRSPASHAG